MGRSKTLDLHQLMGDVQTLETLDDTGTKDDAA